MNKPQVMVLAIICALFASEMSAAQTHKMHPNQERAKYAPSYDNSFDDSDPPSEGLLRALLDSREAKRVLKETPDIDRNNLSNLFRAVKVHLAGPSEVDYLVVGKFPMGGADNDWFWIVRYNRIHPRVIFFANASSVEFLKTRTRGYKNIRTSWSSAAGFTLTDIFQYDGERYWLMHHFERQDKQTP